MRFQNRIFLCLSLFFSLGAQAEIGNVQSDPESSIPTDLETEAAKPAASAPAEPSSQAVMPAPIYRPWNLDLPSGPTAFVLDRNEVEVGAYTVGGLGRKIGLQESRARFRYGITDSLTVGLAPNFRFLNTLVELKWNFLNFGKTSLSINPWTGFLFRDTHQFYIERDQPSAVEIVGSSVIGDRQRWHYGVALGKNKSDLRANEFTAFRGNTAYELRAERSHSLTLSLAPSYSKESVILSTTKGNEKTRREFLVGAAYQYNQKHFGGMAGMEVGPSWTHTYSYYYNPAYYYPGSNEPLTSPTKQELFSNSMGFEFTLSAAVSAYL